MHSSDDSVVPLHCIYLLSLKIIKSVYFIVSSQKSWEV